MKSNATCRYFLVFFILNTFVLTAFAQYPNNHVYQIPNSKEGTVTVKQSEATERVLELYTLQKQSDKGLKGYTINIFTDSSNEDYDAKEGALKARSRFINAFDDVNVELKYNAPFWRVYVGKFYTKSEARKFLGEMQYLFPNTAYIVPEYYKIPDSIE